MKTPVFKFSKIFSKSLAAGLSFLLICSSVSVPLAEAAVVAPFNQPGQDILTQEEQGFTAPHKLREQMSHQTAVIRELKSREQRQDRQKIKSLKDVLQNIQNIIQSKFTNQEEFQSEVERRQRAAASVFGEGGLFNFVKYANGKKVWFKGGQVAKVENERVLDSHGNVSIRNMWDMEYDNKGLLTSYRTETVDSHGNKKSSYWYGATYTSDSVAYGGEGTDYRKLMTGYTEETTDSDGNTKIVDWRNGTYNELNQLTGYTQSTTDINGNVSHTNWQNGQYDGLGRLIGFTENVTDHNNLSTTKNWSDAQYEKNPYYADRNSTPGLSEYNLVGFREEITDSRGRASTREWSNGQYNEFGELISYTEVRQKEAEGRVLIQTSEWGNAEYDSFGQLTQYEESKIGFDGISESVLWDNARYDSKGNLLAYNETTTNHQGLDTIRLWKTTPNGYDNKNRLMSYSETVVDIRGNSTQKTWTADEFDNNNRVLAYHESHTNSAGITSEKIWETDSAGYDPYGQLTHYSETHISHTGIKTEIEWGEAAYDKEGQLLQFKEITHSPLFGTSSRSWANGKYDIYGRLLNYDETRTDPDKNTDRTNWSGAAYDSEGRLLSYTEVSTDIYGDKKTKTWETHSQNYNQFGDLIGYDETIEYPDGTQVKKTRSNAKTNNLGQLTEYTDDLTISQTPSFNLSDEELSSLFSTPIVFNEKTIWSGGRYDANGNLSHYEELRSKNGDLLENREWDGRYNSNNQLIHSHDITDNGQGLITETWNNAYAFDYRGRVANSRQIQIYSDQPKIQIITDSTNREYDRYGQAIGGQEVISTVGESVLGQTVHLTTINRITDSKLVNGELTAYRQTSQTIGTDLSLTWQDYTDEKLVSDMSRSGYTETILIHNPSATNPEVKSILVKDHIKRDWNGRVIAYEDTIKTPVSASPSSQYLERVDKRLATLFDEAGRVISTLDQFQSIEGKSGTTVTENTTFDQRGRTLTFNQTTAWNQTGEIEILNRRQTQFDALGRTIKTEDSSTSNLEPESKITNWEAKRFNNKNQVSNDRTETKIFKKNFVSDDPDSIHVSERSLISYNARGQAASYRERFEDSKEPEKITYREISNLTYDAFGQIATSKQTSLERGFDATSEVHLKGSLSTEVLREDAQFDELGRLIGFRETTHETGRAENGDIIDHKIVRARQSAQYQDIRKDLLVAYTDYVTDSAQPALLTIQNQENIKFDARDRVTEFKQTTQKKGILFERDPADPSNLREVAYNWEENIHRKNIILSDQNHLLAYDQTRSHTDKPDEVVQESWMGTYDKKDRLNYIREIADTFVNNQLTERTDAVRDNITYDREDRISGYIDNTTFQVGLGDEQLSEAVQITNDRRKIKYNNLQQMVSYTETQSRSDEWQKQTIEFEDGRYDKHGRLYSFQQETTTEARENGNIILDTTVSLQRSKTEYNGFGQVSAKTELIRSSETPDLLVTEETSHISYDAQGREYAFVKKSKEENRFFIFNISLPNLLLPRNITKITTREKTEYDDRGRIKAFAQTTQTIAPALDLTERLEKYDQAYNAWNEIISSKEKSWSSQAPDKESETVTVVFETDDRGRAIQTSEMVTSGEHWQKIERSQIQRNAIGQIIGHEETRQTSSSTEIDYNSWSGSYDKNGRLFSSTNFTSNEDGTFQTLTNRSHILYDSFGQMLSYSESQQASITPDDSKTIRWEATGYNNSGQLTGYSQNTKTSGPAVNLEELEIKEDIIYLRNGLIDSFKQTNQKSDKPNISETLVRKNTRYDAFGREFSFNEMIKENSFSGKFEIVTERTRTHSQYNQQHQLIRTNEIIRKNSAPMVAEHINWTGSYNDQGRLNTSFQTVHAIGRNQEGRVFDKTSTNEITNRNYDFAGRLNKETSISHNGTGETTERHWSTKGFDTNGQMTSDNEILIITAGNIKKEINTNRDNYLYDHFGRVTSYSETKEDKASRTTTTQKVEDIAYNNLGQKISERINSRIVDTETNGDNFEKSTFRENNNYEYDDKGRLTGYTESLSDYSLEQKSITKISGKTFNEFGLETASTIETKKQSIPFGIWENTIRETQETLLFNQLGQPEKTESTSWNSTTPEIQTVSKTSNITYLENGQINSFHRLTKKTHLTDTRLMDIYEDEYRTATVYNSRGFIAEITRSLVASDAPSVRKQQKETYTYDAYGQRTDSTLDEKQTTRDGLVNSARQTLSSSAYDKEGRVIKETTSENSSQSPGLIHKNEINYEYGPGGLVSKQDMGQIIEGRGPPLSDQQANNFLNKFDLNNFSEEQKTELLILLKSGQPFLQESFSTISDIQYDIHGSRTEYFEKTQRSNAPEIVDIKYRTGITRNGLGQETGYTEYTQTSDQESFVIDPLDLPAHLPIYGKNNNYIHLAKTTRANAEYDAAGRLVKYEDASIDQTGMRKLTEQIGAEYNFAGQLINKRTRIHQNGQDKVTGDVIQSTVLIEQKDMSYDTEGRLNHYLETSHSSAHGQTTTEWEANSFNNFGQASSVIESGNSTQQGTWRTLKDIFITDTSGQSLLRHEKGTSSLNGPRDIWTLNLSKDGESAYTFFGGEKYKLEWGSQHGIGSFTRITDAQFPDSFDSWGRSLHSQETTITDTGVSVTDSYQELNSFGQVISKSNHTIDTTQNEIRESSSEWSGTYDQSGRQSAFSNHQQTSISTIYGEFLGTVSNSSDREKIEYNNKGQVVSYSEKNAQESRSAMGDVIQSTQQSFNRENITYNDYAQMTSYNEDGTQDGADYVETYLATQFASSGEAIKWSRKGHNESTGVININQTNGKVNEKGQFTSYSQEGISQGQYFSKNVTNAVYNDRGLLTTSQEKGETDSGPYEFTQSSTYDVFGRLQYQAEKGKGPNGVYSSVTSDFEYNKNGRLVSKNIETINALNQKTETNWTIGDKGYDAKGRLIESVEMDLVTDAEGNFVSQTTRHTTHNGFLKNGAPKETITESITENADKSKAHVTSTIKNLDSSKEGLTTEIETETKTNNIDSDKNETNTTQKSTKSGIERYTTDDEELNSAHRAGRIKAYNEKVEQSGTETTYNRKDNIHYDKTGAEIDFTIGAIKTNLFEKAGEAISSLASLIFNFLKDLLFAEAHTSASFDPSDSKWKDLSLNPAEDNSEASYQYDIVRRSDIKKDDLGRDIAWTQKIRSSASPRKETTSEINIKYKGSKNEYETYDTWETERVDHTLKKTYTSQNNFVYEGGKLISVDGVTEQKYQDLKTGDFTLDRRFETHDVHSAWDSLGRPTTTTRTTENDTSAPSLVTEETSVVEYDASGRIDTKTTTTNKHDKDNEKLNVTDTVTERYQYNSLNQIQTIHRTSSSSKKRDETISEVINMGNYDDYGRARTISTDRTTEYKDTVETETVTDEILSFSSSGNPETIRRTTNGKSGLIESESSENITTTYDNQGRVAKTTGNQARTEHELNENGERINTVKTESEIYQQNISYNDLGQLTESRKKNSRSVSTSYDANGKETGKYINDDGGIITETYEYGNQGQITNNVKNTVFSYRGHYAQTIIQTNFNYDENGVVVGTSVTTKTRTHGGYTHTSTVNKVATEINSKGQFTHYTQTTLNDSEAPDRVMTENHSGAIYNSRGQKVSSEVESTTSTLNEDGTRHEEKENIFEFTDYNALGFATNRWELNKTDIQNLEKFIEDKTELVNEKLNNKPNFSQQITDADSDYKKASILIEADRKIALNSYENQMNELNQQLSDWQSAFDMVEVARLWGTFTYEIEKPRTSYPGVMEKVNSTSYIQNNWEHLDNVRQELAGYFYDYASNRVGKELNSLNITKENMKEFLFGYIQNSPYINGSAVNGVFEFKQQEENKPQAAKPETRLQEIWKMIAQETKLTSPTPYYFLENVISTYHGKALYGAKVRDSIAEKYEKLKAPVQDQIDEVNDAYNKKDLDAQIVRDNIVNAATEEEKIFDALIKADNDDITYQKEYLQNYKDEGKTSYTKNITYDENGNITSQSEWDPQNNEWIEYSDYKYSNRGYLETYQKKFGKSENYKVETVDYRYHYNDQIWETSVTTSQKINGIEQTNSVVSEILERDRNGRIISERKTISSSDYPGKKDVTLTDTKYDNESRAIKTVTNSWDIIEGRRLYLGEEVNDAKSFDGLGRVLDYKKSTRLQSEPHATSINQGTHIYGHKGQRVGSIETINKVSKVLNTSVSILNLGTEFDAYGKPLKSLQVTSHDSTAKGKTIYDDITHEYDNKGRLKKSLIKRKTIEEGMEVHSQDITDLNEEFDEFGRVTKKTTLITNDSFFDPSKKVTINQSDITYNEYGRKTGYTETTTDTTIPGEITTITKSEMTYNSDGLLFSFKEVNKDVVRNVFQTEYNKNGQVITQAEKRKWDGTLGGNIQNLSLDWTSGDVTMVQRYSYDETGRVNDYFIDANGSGWNSELSGILVAGSGGNAIFGGYYTWEDSGETIYGLPIYNRVFHQTEASLYLSVQKTDIQYDTRGRVLTYNQSVTQFEKTKERYLSSSKSWSGKRKSKEREVIGHVTRSETVTFDKFNSFGQATEIHTSYAVSNGDYGWSHQTNITYDNRGRMHSATTESWHHTAGKGYTAVFHSKKDQEYVYNDAGKMTETKDIHVHFERKHIDQKKSRNFFASGIGQFVVIVVGVIVGILTYGAGFTLMAAGMASLAATTAIRMAAAEHMGASPRQMWKMAAVAVAIAIITYGIGSMAAPTVQAGAQGANAGATQATAQAGSSGVSWGQIGTGVAVKAPMQYGVSYVGGKIAEKSGNSSAALFTTVASGIMGNTPNTELLINLAINVGMAEVIEHNSKPEEEKSWLATMADGLSGIISNLLNSAALTLQNNQSFSTNYYNTYVNPPEGESKQEIKSGFDLVKAKVSGFIKKISENLKNTINKWTGDDKFVLKPKFNIQNKTSNQFVATQNGFIEREPGQFYVPDGQPLPFGGNVWEPGSQFRRSSDGSFYPFKAVSLHNSVEGISRADGKPIPISTTVNGEGQFVHTPLFTSIESGAVLNVASKSHLANNLAIYAGSFYFNDQRNIVYSNGTLIEKDGEKWIKTDTDLGISGHFNVESHNEDTGEFRFSVVGLPVINDGSLEKITPKTTVSISGQIKQGKMILPNQSAKAELTMGILNGHGTIRVNDSGQISVSGNFSGDKLINNDFTQLQNLYSGGNNQPDQATSPNYQKVQNFLTLREVNGNIIGNGEHYLRDSQFSSISFGTSLNLGNTEVWAHGLKYSQGISDGYFEVTPDSFKAPAGAIAREPQVGMPNEAKFSPATLNVIGQNQSIQAIAQWTGDKLIFIGSPDGKIPYSAILKSDNGKHLLSISILGNDKALNIPLTNEEARSNTAAALKANPEFGLIDFIDQALSNEGSPTSYLWNGVKSLMAMVNGARPSERRIFGITPINRIKEPEQNKYAQFLKTAQIPGFNPENIMEPIIEAEFVPSLLSAGSQISGYLVRTSGAVSSVMAEYLTPPIPGENRDLMRNFSPSFQTGASIFGVGNKMLEWGRSIDANQFGGWTRGVDKAPLLNRYFSFLLTSAPKIPTGMMTAMGGRSFDDYQTDGYKTAWSDISDIGKQLFFQDGFAGELGKDDPKFAMGVLSFQFVMSAASLGRAGIKINRAGISGYKQTAAIKNNQAAAFTTPGRVLNGLKLAMKETGVQAADNIFLGSEEAINKYSAKFKANQLTPILSSIELENKGVQLLEKGDNHVILELKGQEGAKIPDAAHLEKIADQYQLEGKQIEFVLDEPLARELANTPKKGKLLSENSLKYLIKETRDQIKTTKNILEASQKELISLESQKQIIVNDKARESSMLQSLSIENQKLEDKLNVQLPEKTFSQKNGSESSSNSGRTGEGRENAEGSSGKSTNRTELSGSRQSTLGEIRFRNETRFGENKRPAEINNRIREIRRRTAIIKGKIAELEGRKDNIDRKIGTALQRNGRYQVQINDLTKAEANFTNLLTNNPLDKNLTISIFPDRDSFNVVGFSRKFDNSTLNNSIQHTESLNLHSNKALSSDRLSVQEPKYEFNMITNPGPLEKLNNGKYASNFAGGKYNMITLDKDLIVYRGGRSGGGGNAFGQWLTREKPLSEAQIRIDYAVKKDWVNNNTGALRSSSIIESIYEVKIPHGTTIFEGPTSIQSGIYLGGKEQIFIPNPKILIPIKEYKLKM